MAGNPQGMSGDDGQPASDSPAGDSGPGQVTLLRVLVRERHWQKAETFQAQFARAARNLARLEEEPLLAGLSVSARAWDRWMKGKLKTEPRPDACRVLEHMFGYPVRDLLAPVPEDFTPPAREQAKQATEAPLGTGPGGPVTDQARTIDAPTLASPQAELLEGTPVTDPARHGSWDVEDVERRELLRLLGSMALAAPFSGDLDRPRRDLERTVTAPTTGADVAEWERVVDEYELELGRIPPSVALPELLTDLSEAQQRLSGAPEALQAPMARVCGQLSEFTAIQLLTAGDARNAKRYWRSALRVIGLSDDRPVQAMMYGNRAIFGLFGAATSPAASLAYADEAIQIGGGTACAGVAQGYAARAMALAVLGDHRGSIAAIQDLGSLFSRLPKTTAASVTGRVWSEQKLFFFQGCVYAYAGHGDDATKAQEAGLALVPGDMPLPLADFALLAAKVLIRSGDPSEGARHVVRTIRALPVGYQQSSVIRQDAARTLELVPAAVAHTPAVSEARELLSLPPATGLPG